MKILKNKLNQEEKFQQALEMALADFNRLEIMAIFENDYVFCMNIFSSFEEKFYHELLKRMNVNKSNDFTLLIV